MAHKSAYHLAFACTLAALALALPSCSTDSNFTVFGYTTEPNYDCNIHSVRVPIFKNYTFYRGVEFDLTKAVVREIEQKTPYKVLSDDCDADTELTGTIVSYNKNILNRNQLNEVREAETVLGVLIVWRNLRTGEILSKPNRNTPPIPPIIGLPAPPEGAILVQSIGGFIPELGESITTAKKKNVDRLAVQVVSMMEKPW